MEDDLHIAKRVSILLGAGASVEAGLPMTVRLASDLVDGFNAHNPASSSAIPWLQALNFVYGATISHQSRNGDNPNQALNIERLVSALRLLAHKDDHEAAPFIASWKPGAEGFESRRSNKDRARVFARGVEKYVEKYVENQASGRFRSSMYGSDLQRAAADLIADTSPELISMSFADAEEQVVGGVRDRLAEIKTTKYLQPLAELASVQSEGVDVLSLNYDRVVESLAQRNNLSVEKGLTGWHASAPMDFESSGCDIRLYKMHGSVDWFKKGTNSSAVPAEYVEDCSEEAVQDDELRPWMVIGHREKLSTPGPILALVRAAEDALRRTDHLVVVGYSFADEHVNGLIRNWISGKSERTVSIIDPAWSLDGEGFPEDLVTAFGAGERGEEERSSRIFVHRGTTEKRLAKAIRDGQVQPSDRAIEFKPESLDSDAHVELSLQGTETIYDVEVSVGKEDPFGLVEYGSELGLSRTPIVESAQTSYQKQISVGKWRPGEPLRLRTVSTLPDDPVIFLRYRRLDSLAQRSARVVLRGQETQKEPPVLGQL